jgi:hypothetical protein
LDVLAGNKTPLNLFESTAMRQALWFDVNAHELSRVNRPWVSLGSIVVVEQVTARQCPGC